MKAAITIFLLLLINFAQGSDFDKPCQEIVLAGQTDRYSQFPSCYISMVGRRKPFKEYVTLLSCSDFSQRDVVRTKIIPFSPLCEIISIEPDHSEQ